MPLCSCNTSRRRATAKPTLAAVAWGTITARRRDRHQKRTRRALRHRPDVGGMPLILRARAAWAHDWVNSSSVTAAFQVAPGSSFIVNSSALVPSDSALASLEAEVRLNSNWSLAAKFDGQFANSSQTYLGTGYAALQLVATAYYYVRFFRKAGIGRQRNLRVSSAAKPVRVCGSSGRRTISSRGY